MAYRAQPKQECKPSSAMQKVTTPSHIYIQNGAKANMALACWYQEIPEGDDTTPRCRHWNHHGHSCIRHGHTHCNWNSCHDFSDLEDLIPIHLIEEGYTDVVIALDPEGPLPEGELVNSGYIDTEDDWIVRLNFSANFVSFDRDVNIRYTAFVESETARDVLATGVITILAGPNTIEPEVI